jgi:hypothetical protein
MSRQSKNKRVTEQRKQVTATHKKSVASSGIKRTKQPKEQRASVGFTKKLTGSKKGRCIVKDGEKN